jgi:predicted nucleic acid-binding protein
MPEVIADTSVMQYLFQTDLFSLLHDIYGQIQIPLAVRNELKQGRDLGLFLPQDQDFEWIRVVSISDTDLVPQIPGLGRGEHEVMSLTKRTPGALALIDDGLARRYAKQLDIRFTGTLGILLKAKQAGLIKNIAPVLAQLNALGFRMDHATKQGVLKLADEIQVSG